MEYSHFCVIMSIPKSSPKFSLEDRATREFLKPYSPSYRQKFMEMDHPNGKITNKHNYHKKWKDSVCRDKSYRT